MSDSADKTIACIEPGCGMSFIFTAGEQSFFSKQGFSAEPRRCKACREKRKATRENAGAAKAARGPAAVVQGYPEDDEGRGSKRGRRSRSR